MTSHFPPIHPDIVSEISVTPRGGQVRVAIVNLARRAHADLSIEETRELAGQLIHVVEDHYMKAGKA
jgi:hypothetical protein